MNMLSAIVDAATQPVVDVASLLRKVKVVGARLGTGELSGWVDQELNGYAPGADLPTYRGPFPAEAMGLFVGPFNSQVTLAIPSQALLGLRPDARGLFQVEFRQPVAELAELARTDRPERAGHSLQNPWAADTLSAINHLISRGDLGLVPMHHLASAWRVITPAEIRAVMDNVVTRVLGLALDLENLDPRTGEADAPVPDPTRLTTIIHNNIFGSGNNVAVGAGDITQNASQIVAGDLDALLKALRASGLEDDEITELRTAIMEDGVEGAHDTPGPRVKEFLGKLLLKTGGLAGKVGVGAAGTTVGALIKAYYNIG
jgi:hypothetical protein